MVTRFNSGFTLKDCLFDGIKLAEKKKNANPDKYIYSGYGIGLDSRSEFQLPYGSVGENVIIFGIDLSSSGNIENEKKRYILGTILSIDPTQGLDDTTLTAETKYSINFLISNKDFCLRLHCNGRNRFFPAGPQRPEDFPLWSCFGLGAPDHNRT